MSIFYKFCPSVMTTALMEDFGITATTLGTVSAFYYYTYTAFQIPAGLLFDRYGARMVLTITVLLCAFGLWCAQKLGQLKVVLPFTTTVKH
ncbi:MAG: MFS transporter [Gammaproteobacteria bacterium]|nr:MFS transporter [Gammaproteobacteria bacterium]